MEPIVPIGYATDAYGNVWPQSYTTAVSTSNTLTWNSGSTYVTTTPPDSLVTRHHKHRSWLDAEVEKVCALARDLR